MYRKVLIGLDLSQESKQVVARAREVLPAAAEIHLVNVFEPLDAVYFGVVPYAPVMGGTDNFEDSVRKQMRERLDELGEAYQIPDEQRHLLTGSPAAEIRKMADENDFDLIIVGTHGRAGVRLLLGSTANAVLHGVKCDVLAVRIDDPEE
ncbi:MAG: universal stress protein [Wenzhouxiangellaceae bacterium]